MTKLHTMEIKKIDGSDCSRYPNPLHLQSHERMYGYISEAVGEKTGIEPDAELLPGYHSNILLEVKRNHAIQSSVEIGIQEIVDRDRDNLLSFTFNTVHNAEKSLIPAQREAYAVLKLIIKDYLGLQSEGIETETAHIDGLVTALEKPENAVHIAALGLTDYVAALKAKNQEFSQSRIRRVEARADNATEDSKTIRRRTDSCYNQLCAYIEAHYLLCKTDENRQAIAHLIDIMNETIAEFKALYHQSLAQNKKK